MSFCSILSVTKKSYQHKVIRVLKTLTQGQKKHSKYNDNFMMYINKIHDMQ